MDNDSNAIVKLENVWVQYNSVVALEDVTMWVAADDFIGIIGPNGGGKSTLLKVLLGLVKHTRGKIEIFGTTPQKANKKIGYVAQYQNFDRNFPIDVWNVVLMGRLGHAGLLHRYSQNDHMAQNRLLKRLACLPTATGISASFRRPAAKGINLRRPDNPTGTATA
jgi:zinc transport system ATP-binding protein